MLSKPMLIGRIGKWILTLSEFSFQYVPQRAIKGQAIAYFLAEHQESQKEIINVPGTLKVASVWISPSKAFSGKEEWIQQNAAGVGIVIIDPRGTHHCYSFILDYQETTNNQAKYEALIISLEILIDLGATEVEVFGDSELGTEILVSYIPRESNAIANEMAQLASRAQIQERKFEGDIEVQKRNLPSIFERGFSLDVMTEEMEMEDWRTPIIQYLKDPSFPTSKKNIRQAIKYVMWDKMMLRRTPDGLLLKCLGQDESMRVMAEIHEEIYGAHQAGTKMRW
ncbi:uncharacterized protein [Malus domestica]|uniref:uncharacterized protein n=1 Tax=Malus domestica TaxID=3750 RepID=UPI000498DB7A